MMEEPRAHRPVLLDESVAALAIRPDGVYIDGTFGRGGHSRQILDGLGEAGRLIGIDKDPEAITHAQEVFAGDGRFVIERGSFALLAEIAEQQGVTGKVDGILLDLGVSSPQLDQAERGFSFMQEGPLDMRMDPEAGFSAAEWLMGAETKEIADVLKTFGEERHARRIARAIVAARQEQPIRTTRQLSEIVSAANPSWEKGKHPATRCFQGIRIFINRELEDLERFLDQVLEVLAPGGRLAVISFHSLEDRMIKRFMRDQAKGDRFPSGVPVTQAQLDPKLRLLGKAIRAGKAELEENPRSRSAVLRVAERLS
ncbi:16S rRNA (cytosine(1402)-N(4))-methyltransferase RsmH [bacterium endosymbiont of Escarpia laminata]|nr:MAG: 16S rRNA (cytosine(1402)-N(4))-methyltransferase RsmH [bacterium endosymbiont of Escarpia laminata]RLJ22584.1 MAG: 16S rRNA (cytosine(1402)-N(4))-methyltransferase RsmH [bacterium endosymbiont of Escarpia laminata]